MRQWIIIGTILCSLSTYGADFLIEVKPKTDSVGVQELKSELKPTCSTNQKMRYNGAAYVCEDITSSSILNFASEVIAAMSTTLSNFLGKDNTTAYTPTSDYHPATKKYVDNKVSAIPTGAPSVGPSNSVQVSNGSGAFSGSASLSFNEGTKTLELNDSGEKLLISTDSTGYAQIHNNNTTQEPMVLISNGDLNLIPGGGTSTSHSIFLSGPNVFLPGVHNSAAGAMGPQGRIASGTFLPTLTYNNGTASVNGSGFMYTRVGNIVTVYRRINVSTTSSSLNNSVSFALPSAIALQNTSTFPTQSGVVTPSSTFASSSTIFNGSAFMQASGNIFVQFMINVVTPTTIAFNLTFVYQ